MSTMTIQIEAPSIAAPVSSANPPSPPTPADVAWVAAITAAKASVVALALDAFLNSSSLRYSGKAMRIRAIGYAGGMLLVPLAWRLRGRPQPYPRELDMAVTLPLLVDAGGNAIGIYRRAHVDDLIHFADGQTQQVLMVRLPEDAQAAAPAQPKQ